MALIKCENVTLGYEGKAVVSDLNFEVRAGEYLYIVGENGSGKSTLMKALLGLINPLSGNIIRGDGLLKNEIGYLPQQTVVQKDFPAAVKEIVLSGCLSSKKFRPFYSGEDKALAKKNMQKMGIEDLANRSYKDLSGGQQQRVLLARALCATEKIILLDEPVSGLDPKATQEMYDIIEKLNKERNITIIMISHDIDAAKKYASHILRIGENVVFETKEAFVKANR